ncbi:phosphate ABC transporter substrate-binding protein PstS [Candidatus Acetothermia bacterium]|nr:phosphate ABC transporter substrate-binding protein PstS [Candidatus Acetothermia bacterium]MBI3460390.1 phosphate ABC transporter substrate-binding protein PstS [Candidatus Acetothermia bacterium]
MLKKWLNVALLVAAIGATAVGQSGVTLNGAGATFPALLYQKWAKEFKTQTGVEINYQAIGSGGGIKAIQDQTVDFGGSDAWLKDDNIVDIPTVAGAVTLTFNVPALGCTLKLSKLALANIFLGKIRKWNDGVIAAINGGCKLPDANITVVHRSDGSGTTNIFTSYLSKISEEWKTKVGAGTSVNWPTDALGGLAGPGNAGVTQAVTQNPNSLGYVELIYARQNKLPVADVENAKGKFVTPTLDTTRAALAGITTIPADFNLSSEVLDVNADGVYPIVGPTYLLVYKDFRNIKDAAKAQALVDLLCWAVNSNGKSLGQDFADDLDFAALPSNVTTAANNVVKTLTFQGKSVNTARFCK